MQRALPAAGLVALFVAIAAALVAGIQAPPSTAGGLVAPASLGGARLASSLRGPAALAEISRLHGRRIGGDDALMAGYEYGLLLWVTASGSAFRAGSLLFRMNRGMSGGTDVFTAPRGREIRGRTVFITDGLGQRHAYYQSGRYVVWLAAPAAVAEQALQDLLHTYP